MAYSEFDRATAVEIVARNNGVLDASTLSAIRAALGAPKLPGRTVRNWMQEGDVKISSLVKKDFHSGSITVQEVVSQRLDDKLEAAAHTFVDHATRANVVDKMNGQQAMTSAAIAIDKMRLLRDLPTEIVSIMPELVAVAKRHNLDALAAVRALINAMDEEVDAERQNA